MSASQFTAKQSNSPAARPSGMPPERKSEFAETTSPENTGSRGFRGINSPVRTTESSYQSRWNPETDISPAPAGSFRTRDLGRRQFFVEVHCPVAFDNVKPLQRLPSAGAMAANSCRKLEQRTVP